MAVNRSRSDRFRNNKMIPVALAIAVGVVIGIVILMVLGSRGVSSDPNATTRSQALAAANALDVFEIEYPKPVNSGAGPALGRVQTTFAAAQVGLSAIDPARTSQLSADLTTLTQKTHDHAPSDEVTALAEKVKQEFLAFTKS